MEDHHNDTIISLKLHSMGDGHQTASAPGMLQLLAGQRLRGLLQVGGLGDVVTGLARACIERGHAVEVMLPYYESLPDEGIQDLQHSQDFECPKVRIARDVHAQG